MQIFTLYVRTYYIQLIALGVLILTCTFLESETPLLLFALVGGCGNEPSTPFLYVWDGKKHQMENDVMFGKPISCFSSLDEGMDKYKNGDITPDIYFLQTKPCIENGKIKMQLKEIEPEKSAVDFISLTAVRVPQNISLITKSDFTGYVSVNTAKFTADMEAAKKMKITLNGVESSKVRAITRQEQLEMREGDLVEIVIKEEKSRTQYLIVDSWYRDWTLGPIYWGSKQEAVEAVPSNFMQKFAPSFDLKKGVTTGVLASLAVMLGVGVHAGSDKSEVNHDPFFSVPTANAGAAESNTSDRSFELSYKTGDMYNKFEVIEPRYFKPSYNAVKIPESAFVDGEAVIRIAATKRHNLSGLGVITAEENVSDNTVVEYPLTLESAVDVDSGEELKSILTDTYDGQFSFTHPGSMYSLTFDASGIKANNNERIEYFFRMGGVYQAVPQEEQKALGDWTKNLDDDALTFLEDVYKLNHQG